MAVFDGGRIVEVVYDSNLTLERLPEVCRTYTIEKAIVATVIDLSREVLSQLEDMAVPILWLNEKTSLPVENLYETPRTLGYDRMAAVVAANEQFPGKDILVAVHYTNIDDMKKLDTLLTGLQVKEIDYDIVGLSFYPY